MNGNFQVRFLEGKGGVIPPTYSTNKGLNGIRKFVARINFCIT